MEYSSNNYNNNNFNNLNFNLKEENEENEEETFEEKLSEFGSKVKNGLFFVGGKIKDSAISGYNFVKNKFKNEDENN